MSRSEGDLPFEHDAARGIVQPALAHPGADGVEVVVSGSTTGLTRFANSQIIQNTVREDIRVYVRVVVGDRVASGATNGLDPARIERAVAQAVEAARASLADREFPGLADPAEVGRPEPVWRWDHDTAVTSPSARADAVAEFLRAAGSASAAGFLETGGHAFAVFSSAGVDCYDAYSRCSATCLVDTGGSTGWGQASSFRASEIQPGELAHAALSKAEAGRAPGEAAPGAYEVVLEPPAVATLLDYLSYVGFGGKGLLDGDSFFVTQRGREVASRLVTIADDVFHPASVGIGFDLEGVPRQRVDVIAQGVAERPVFDLRTAHQLGETTTGHASGSAEFGPYAANVVLEAGDASAEELVAGVDDGLLVTRFHYVNVLDRPATLLTGMTRDGTFRIRGGEVAEPVRNLRFTQSALDALASVVRVGRDAPGFAPDYGAFGSTVAPALQVGEFRFTSGTSH